MLRVLCALMIFPAALFAESTFPINLYHFQQEFPPYQSEIRLSHQFVIPNSEAVIVGGQSLMRGVDYSIICMDGYIKLNRTPEDTIIITYDIFPFELRKVYFHRAVPEPEMQKSDYTPAVSGKMAEEEETPFKFTRSGSIFRSVTVGSNRDASLESGMDFKLNGRLGIGTTVTAALSDQNIPIQPEGDTRTLEEIDKVYVKVESGNYGVNLGDYDLNVEKREFAALNRKLTGVQAYASGEDITSFVSAASSKGEYRSQSFNGVEGLQGPYFLTGKRGETGILVIAGSEKVWLDGYPLTRGDDYDYIIDYSRGEINFTEKRPIDSDSRVVVDFQYSSGDYNRSLYHSAGTYSTPGRKWSFSYAAASEADDKNNPLLLSYDESAKSSLRSAGNDRNSAFISGEEYSPGEGDYDKIYQADSSFIYVWAGKDSGDYDAAFSYIGENQGAYMRQFSTAGDIYYEYAGSGLGAYDPILLLPLPRLEQTIDMSAMYKPSRNLSLSLETAASNYDRNTFSPLNDSSNKGLAASVSINADSLEIADIKAGFSAKTRSIDDNFHPPDRISGAEYNRQWGYADSSTSQENSVEGRSYLLPFPNLKFSGGAGYLEKSDFQSSRFDFRTDYVKSDILYGSVFGENISLRNNNIPGYWRRGKSELWRRWGKFTPAFKVEGEDNSQGGDGFRFGEYTGSVKYLQEKGLLVEHTYRDDRTRQDYALEPQSYLNRSHMNYQGGENLLNYTLDYTHSRRDYAVSDSADITSDLGRITGDYRSQDGFITANFQHRITQSRTAETALIPFEVGWGEGEYIKEGDQYFQDPNGNYLLVAQPTGNYLRSAQVRSAFTLRLDFRRSPAALYLPILVRQLTSESNFAVDEESKTPDPYKLYLLYLPAFRSDSTLYGNSSFRQDLFYRRNDRNFNLRFRFNDYRSLNNRLITAGERTVRDDFSLQLWKSLSSQLSMQAAAAHSTEKRWLSAIPDRDLSINSLENVFIQQVSRPLEIRLGLKIEKSQDAIDNISASSYSLHPQADYSLFNKGRITVESTYTEVVSDAETLPYEMTSGKGVGSNYEWSARASYKIGNNLNLTLNYNGESKIGRPVIHTGKMELRAFF